VEHYCAQWSLLEAEIRDKNCMCNANSKEERSYLKELYAKRPPLEFYESKRYRKHML
jgi:hypothetical protein